MTCQGVPGCGSGESGRCGGVGRLWVADICGNNRVAFNVGGNKYRLVVEVQYHAGIVWVNFVGTHEQYNRIDVESGLNEH